MQHDPTQQCVCDNPAARYTCFESSFVGCDETKGRFADVTLKRCTTCGRLWLHYSVEYQAFSRSGRWARGLITEADAARITPVTAAAYIDGLDEYIYGGCYFETAGQRSSGPMHWDL